MSTQDKARELMAQERQQELNRHESMLERASADISQENDILAEKARELLAGDRQQEKHLEETMLERSMEALQ